MDIQNVNIDELKPAEYNPRTMPHEEMEALKANIQANGFVVPVLVNSHPDRKNVIIGGHQRVAAAKAIGMAEVPCIFVEKTPEEEKQLNLALNRISGDWDKNKLPLIMRELKASDGLQLTGFKNEEISRILDTFKHPQEKGEAPIEVPDNPTSQPGEVYELGQHRLICGDATDPATYEKLIGEEKANMLWTDPPYNVDYHSRGDTLKGGGKDSIENDHMEEEDFKLFVESAFSSMLSALSEGSSIYVCSEWSSYAPFLIELDKLGFHHAGVIIWVKDVASMGWNDYRYKHEWVIKGKKKQKKKARSIIYGWIGSRHSFYGARNEYDVWEMPRKSVMDYLHPTEKPDWLIMRAMRNSSQRDQIVLDPFAGSGSVMEAAEKTGRRAFMIEKDPKFCDVIRERYKRFDFEPVQ